MAAQEEKPSVELTASQKAAIETLGTGGPVIPHPLWMAREARMPNDELMRRAALKRSLEKRLRRLKRLRLRRRR